jgi:hypothetical protein
MFISPRKRVAQLYLRALGSGYLVSRERTKNNAAADDDDDDYY